MWWTSSSLGLTKKKKEEKELPRAAISNSGADKFLSYFCLYENGPKNWTAARVCAYARSASH
jgi:hypothetical protein